MRLLEPLAERDAVLARRNPTAKLAAGALLTFLLVASVDPVTPAVAVALELAVVPLFGVRYRTLLRRGWPFLVSAATVFLVTLLFTTRRGGATLLEIGPLTLTALAVDTALGLSLRILAVSLPGLLLLATTDPTDLADSLVQQARAPARFAIGALAAFRLVPLLADEWEMLTLARRARGVDAGRNPVARLRLFASTTFALMVGAIRRGTRLATAMEARAFDSGAPRTVARPQRFTPADGLLVLGAVAVAMLALGTSIATDNFRPLL